MAKKGEMAEVVDAELIGWQGSPKLVEFIDRYSAEAQRNAEGGDGASMLEDILASEDVDVVAGGNGTAVSIGTTLIPRPGQETENFLVTDVKVLPSDKPGAGLPIFLVISAIDMSSGELVTLTGGGNETTIRLLRLRELGGLPRVFQWIRKDTPTAAGFHPINMRDLGRPYAEDAKALGA